jgi:plasmid stabilization system protein ParE
VPRRLRYTEKAGDDLDDVRRWLTQPGAGFVAQRRLAAIRADIRRLNAGGVIVLRVYGPGQDRRSLSIVGRQPCLPGRAMAIC